MKKLHAKVSTSAAFDVADYLTRKLDTDCPLPMRQGWKDVADALYALANDTDFIVTDESVVPDASARPAEPLPTGKRREDGTSDYCVTWEIDITAESPVEAAREALAIMRKPDSSATVFDVADGNDVKRVDLTAVDEDDSGDLCRDCGQPYEDGGDGYNGRCPDCADVAEAEGRADE